MYEIAYNAGPFAQPPAAGFALAEEESQGYDVGVEYNARAGCSFELTYFDQEIEDEIFFDLDGVLRLPAIAGHEHVERGRSCCRHAARRALEPARQLDAQRRRELDERAAAASAEEHRQLRSVVSRRRRSASASSPNYRLSKDSIDIGGVALDDYEVLDLSGNYAFGGGFEIFGRVENATDEEYQEVIGYNTAARSTYLGVRLRF